jgi:cytochrome c-type biogenesis protein CcmH
MRTPSILIAPLLALALTTLAWAGTLAEFSFDDPQKTEDFRALTSELRCLVCQNESLAGSNADLAQDLRKEIYEMMQAGKSKEDIIDFMVARYGDFVLYRPPLKPSTYPLWFGPLLLLLIGGFLLYRTLRRKQRSAEVELSEEERTRLSQLLNNPENKS